jgi:TRAP-type C4-dicarboxylate transport system permease small subunit
MRIDHVYYGFMKWALFLITGCMTLIVLLGVVFRYILKAPLPWSEELSRYLMVWAASLGAAVAFKEGSHVAVTLLCDQFYGITRKILRWISQTIMLVFMIIVMVKGFVLAFELRTQISPAMEIPMTWPYLAIPVGCLFIVLEILILPFSTGPDTVREGKSP